MKVAILLVFLLFLIFTCFVSSTRPNTKHYEQLNPTKPDTQTEDTAFGMTSQSPQKDKIFLYVSENCTVFTVEFCF
ncbi:unnamed protein product [Meloidogyne enterolobii]|uniref:Uncharacterized protein n=1 Tax=Meloidogyne enterolobii TaxID=390850 RepID=A0ACB1ATA1_MELEN